MGNHESKTKTEADKEKPTKSEGKTNGQNKLDNKTDGNQPNAPKKIRTFVESTVDESTRLAFDDWMNERLTKYFEDIQEKILKLKISQSERNEIGTAVGEFLDFLFTETERVDRRFRFDNFRDVYKVGTYHENLEIISVDQLEYCIVLDELSTDNIESIEKISTDDDEYLKVYLKENCAIRWDEIVEKEADNKHMLRSDNKGLSTIFFDRVAKAVDSVRTKNRDSVYRKHGRLDLLEVDGVVKRGHSVELKFSWNKEAIITVTLTPCVRYDGVNSMIAADSTISQIAHTVVKRVGKLLLQPVVDAEEYFQWHFGHVELVYMKDHVNKTHNEVYQMITFLVQGYNRKTVEESEFFSDLALKTLIITHCCSCKKKDRLGDCVLEILDEMQKLLKGYRDDDTEPAFLRNPFYIHQNALPTSCRQCKENSISMNLAGLEQIANHLVKEIGCTALYDFNKSIKNLIPLNAFILKKDYIARKYGTNAPDDAELEARKALVDAVSNEKFTVRF